MNFVAKRIKRPSVRSSYHRLQGCDCPDCRPRPVSALKRLLAKRDAPAGPWSTVIFIIVIAVIVAAYYYLRPELVISTAIKG